MVGGWCALVLGAAPACNDEGVEELAPAQQAGSQAAVSGSPAGAGTTAPRPGTISTSPAVAPAGLVTTPTTPATPTSPSGTLPTVAVPAGKVALGGRWELPRGADGQPLSLEAQRERARATLARMQAERRELIDLSGSREPGAEAALLERITGAHPARIKVDAMFQLGDTRRDSFVPALTALLTDKQVDVRAEAAVRLYRWGERRLALPHLKELSRLGVIVTRAFHEDWKDGRFTFTAGAADFFSHALSSPTPEVRIDAAVGLLDLDVPHDEALRVLKAIVFEAYRPDERLYAVSRLAVISHLPKVRAILTEAQRDADEGVAARARKILEGDKRP